MSVPVRLLPMGDRAVLAETDGLDAVLALHARLAASRAAGVTDLVPAARTVLVRVEPAVLPLAAARTWILRVAAGEDARSAPDPADPVRVVLDVAYDGPDLAETAELLGVSAAELVRRHTDAVWRVAFTGFAPGFGYLVSPDWPLDVPRLPVPRTRVPAGSVAVAGAFSGAYPRETPGGWRILGTTDAPLFDPGAAEPVLLSPGTEVRFRPARALSHGAPVPPPAPAPDPRAGIEVLAPGLLATVQDLGRPGNAARGVAGSGALDRGALRTANRLLGNPEGAAGIEVTLGGFEAVAARDAWFAVAGAWGPVRVDGREAAPYAAHPWPAGARLELGWLARGARAYLAIRGGVDARAVMGSRSTDVLAGLGPAPLRAGDRLAIGDDAGPVPALDIAPWGPPADDDVVVDLTPGPRADWFAASALRALRDGPWRVTNDADRVGVRLDGPVLDRARDGELPSEGMVPGAIQVPPSGRPTILLADGPVTGGYPVIAVVADASLDRLAQARPGARIRFRRAASA